MAVYNFFHFFQQFSTGWIRIHNLRFISQGFANSATVASGHLYGMLLYRVEMSHDQKIDGWMMKYNIKCQGWYFQNFLR